MVLEVIEAAVDSGGGDEEGEAGGDDEPEAVPCLVLHHGQGAEESVGEQEDEGAEQRTPAVVEVKKHREHGEEHDEEEGAEEGDAEDADLNEADVEPGGELVGVDDEEGSGDALDFEEAIESIPQTDDERGLGIEHLRERAALVHGLEVVVKLLGEISLDLKDEDGHAGSDGEETEVDGEVVVGRGVERTSDLHATLREPPEEELIDPDAEVIKQAAEHEVGEFDEAA